MQISNRFTIAVHICVCLLVFADDHKITSEFLAGSTGVNPVMVRNSLGQLRQAGLVKVRRGAGGAVLAKDPADITLFDIYQAVEPYPKDEGMFRFHGTLNPDCPVASHMHDLMDDKLLEAQQAMEDSLKKTTLEDLKKHADALIRQDLSECSEHTESSE